VKGYHLNNCKYISTQNMPNENNVQVKKLLPITCKLQSSPPKPVNVEPHQQHNTSTPVYPHHPPSPHLDLPTPNSIMTHTYTYACIDACATSPMHAITLYIPTHTCSSTFPKPTTPGQPSHLTIILTPPSIQPTQFSSHLDSSSELRLQSQHARDPSDMHWF
jgi:hypothetical protein